MSEEKRILIKDLYNVDWNHSDETIRASFIDLIKKDKILFNIFGWKMFDPLNIDISVFEEWKKRMPINKEPDLKEIPTLLSSYSSLLATISTIYITLNLYNKKFQQANEYYISTLYQTFEEKIKTQIETYHSLKQQEKETFEKSIELDKKYEKLKQDYLKSNLDNIENKYNNLIDIEKKKMSSLQMESYIKRDIIVNEFKRKIDIIEFAKLYLSDCNSVFNENINSLKKILSIHELLYRNAWIQ